MRLTITIYYRWLNMNRHALGMLQYNTEYQRQVPTQTLLITSPRPYPGTTIYMFSGHIDQRFTLEPLMVSLGIQNERKLISGGGHSCRAQLSTFNNPNLDPMRLSNPRRAFTGISLSGMTLTIQEPTARPMACMF